MEANVILEKQDLTYLKWSHVRSSSGTTGSFLKSESNLHGKKIYYKLSNYVKGDGIVGHECVNEIIVDRLLTVLGVEHLSYSLINAEIEIDGKRYCTYLCSSGDFKERGESKIAMDTYYRENKERINAQDEYDFCKRLGLSDYIDTMIAVDYIIGNRDRHGANIELLRNSRKKTLRVAPLFDHGISLLSFCRNEKEIENFDVMEDKTSNNFIGSRSCLDNLKLLNGRKAFARDLTQDDREYIFADLDGIVSELHINRIWEMIYERYKIYESL